MKERYRKVHKNKETPMFCFCTFHSFCYSLICEKTKVAQYLGYYQGIPQIADDILRTMCRQQCGTKISDDKLDSKVKITKSEKFQKEIYWK
jgi:superfamily I DNA/RNA helicase